MKKITLIGIAQSSPLIQQAGDKETASFAIDIKGYKVDVVCKTEKLVSHARLNVTQHTPIAIEGNMDMVNKEVIVTSILTMKQ